MYINTVKLIFTYFNLIRGFLTSRAVIEAILSATAPPPQQNNPKLLELCQLQFDDKCIAAF